MIMEFELNYISSLFKVFPYMKIKQLQFFLNNMFNYMSDQLIDKVIFTAQSNGHILLSKDGWVVSTQYYLQLTKDKFYDCIDRHNYYFLKNEHFENELTSSPYYDKALVGCIWVVCSFQNGCCYNVNLDDVWRVTFINKKYSMNSENTTSQELPSEIIQVIYIPMGDEISLGYYLKNQKISVKEEEKPYIKRICIMENPKNFSYIPHVGISAFVELTEESFDNFEVFHRIEDELRWECYD